jgi:hypothetical protein
MRRIQWSGLTDIHASSIYLKRFSSPQTREKLASVDDPSRLDNLDGTL